jgi:purine-binding chemotaxis protein CheW
MELALTFRLGEDLFGLAVPHIQEVVESPPLHYIPRSPAGFLGAINCHGRILPVLDLAAHLGLGGDCRDARVVVLAPEACAVALAVTTLQRFVPLAAATEQPAAGEEAVSGCVAAILEHEGENIRLLDVARLRASLEKTVKVTGGDHGA